MATAQDPTWKSRKQAEEACLAHEKEQAQTAAIREEITKGGESTCTGKSQLQARDFEGGFGGQEDLEDKYATTSGEH